MEHRGVLGQGTCHEEEGSRNSLAEVGEVLAGPERQGVCPHVLLPINLLGDSLYVTGLLCGVTVHGSIIYRVELNNETFLLQLVFYFVDPLDNCRSNLLGKRPNCSGKDAVVRKHVRPLSSLENWNRAREVVTLELQLLGDV